jgi:hypothetical protein
MIQFTCPNNNVPERTYAIDALFADVLGCNRNDYSVQFRDDVHNYELNVDGKAYTIEDHFFNRFVEPLSYLKLENIPEKLNFFHGLGLELPIIYGEDKFVRKENGAVIGLDIFASTFFMLTRWEESLLGREEKGDCDESQLFCVKQGIHQRPIVNEYADLLREFLPSEVALSTRNFEVVLSHDVDGFVTPTWTRIAKDFVKQTIHGAPTKVKNLTWKEEIKYKCAFPTAYSQFEMYTALTERHNIPEWFYFKVCGKGETEATYWFDEKLTKEVIGKLKKEKNPHYVLGFHPSQNTFGIKEQWDKEVSRITELLQEKPTIGRNHHLLYNYETLRLWETIIEKPLNISNCVFHRRLGFRSGICIPYNLFDTYQRRKMNLVEHPCIIMDSAIRLHKYKTKKDLWDDIEGIVDQVKKYSGCLVLTWHIYVRNKSLLIQYFNLCGELLEYASNVVNSK